MYLDITKTEANIIQVALDHLYDEHTEVLASAIREGDSEQAKQSYHIQRSIEDLQEEIIKQLKTA